MEFLKDVLGVDLYNQVAEALKGHEKDIKLANLATGDYVSKGKYDSDLQARDTRIAELTKEVQDYDGVDVKKLQQDVADWQKKYTDDIEAERIASKVQLAVAKSGTRSEKALLGMLDFDKITIGDDGEVKGLDEQIADIKKEDDFLFTAEPKPKTQVNLGGKHADPAQKTEINSIEDAVADYYKDQQGENKCH